MRQSLGPSYWLKKKWECWFLPVRIYGIAAYRRTSNISELDAFSSLHSCQVCHPWLLSLPRPCPGIAVSCDGIVPFCPRSRLHAGTWCQLTIPALDVLPPGAMRLAEQTCQWRLTAGLHKQRGRARRPVFSVDSAVKVCLIVFLADPETRAGHSLFTSRVSWLRYEASPGF